MTQQIETECTERNILRIAWYGAVNKPVAKAAYEYHIRTCPACRAYFAELDAAARNATHPEVEE